MFGFKHNAARSIAPQPAELDPSAVEKSGNLAIHVMPQNFRSAAARQGGKLIGALILAIGFIALAGIAAAGYYFAIGQNNRAEKENTAGIAASGTPKSAADQLAGLNKDLEQKGQGEERPSGQALERYLKFREDIRLVGDLEDYQTLVNNYGSPDYQGRWKAVRAKLEGADDEVLRDFADLLKSYYPKKEALLENLQEKSANTSLALLKMRSGYDDFSVTMSLEDSRWVVDQEAGIYYFSRNGATTTMDDWLAGALLPKEKQAESAAPGKQLMPGRDEDNDGLSDKEENLIGTDPKTADSDGDGYGDFTEFMNLFNPAGTGKLADNSNISEYYNPTFGYRILIPAAWTSESIGGDDSIIIKTPESQFMQVIVTPNSGRQEIEEWFKNQFNAAEVNYNSIIEKRDEASNAVWRGMKNESGLTVYLTGGKKEYIYTFSYNLGQSGVLDYINIFNAMIKSLSL